MIHRIWSCLFMAELPSPYRRNGAFLLDEPAPLSYYPMFSLLLPKPPTHGITILVYAPRVRKGRLLIPSL